jgi:hypothetical protein
MSPDAALAREHPLGELASEFASKVEDRRVAAEARCRRAQIKATVREIPLGVASERRHYAVSHADG